MAVGQIGGESFCCAISSTAKSVTYRYRQGSLVYSINKARKGIMEALMIKVVRLISSAETFGQVFVMYVDTLNGLWSESDLCTETEARALAIAYLQEQQALIIDALENC